MSENLQNIWTPFKIILIYIIFGCLWILLSDSLLAWLVNDAPTLSKVQMYKGWFYVFVTAGFLYGLIKRSTIRQSQIEKAHLEAGQKYSELIENAHDLIYTVDLKGNFQSINKAGEEITKYKREEILTLNLIDIVDQDDAEYVRMMFADPHIIESFPSVEIKIRCKDGKTVVLEVKNKLVAEDDKNAVIQGIARDITQRKFDEEQLKDRETQLRDLVSTANEGIWTIDEDGTITFANTKLAEMLGYEVKEMLGTSFLNYMDEEYKILAERNLKRRRSGISEQIDYKLKKRDGSFIWVIASTNPIYKKGEFAGALAMMNDITKRRHEEEENAKLTVELESQKTYLKYIISNVPGIVWETHFSSNPNRKDTVFVSDYVEKMLGYSVSEWVESNDFWLKIIHPEDREKVISESKAIYNNKEINQTVQHYRWVKKNGDVIWVETRMQIERAENGMAFSARGVTIDITEQQEAEDKLRLSEERFRSLVNATAQIVWRANAEGVILSAHDRRGREIEVGKNGIKKLWLDKIHPQDRERVLEKYEQTIKEGKTYRDEYRLLHFKENNYHYYISRGTPIFEKDGKLREWVGTLTDITKEVNAENTLRISEERYRALAHGAHVVWLADAKGMITSMPLWSEMTGQSQEEYQGRGWLNAVHPDDLELVAESWEQALKARDIFDAEYRVKHKDGTYIYHHGRGVPILNADGTIREWIGTCLNIAGRREAERISRENEDRYLAIASSAAFFWTADAKGYIYKTGVNISEVEEAEEFIAEDNYFWWLDIIHPDERISTAENWKNCVKNKQIYEIENRIITKDGTHRNLYTRAVPVFNQNGEVREWVGIGFDITEPKKIEQQLVEKQKSLDFALNAGKLGTWHIDLADRSINYNNVLLENLGLSGTAEFSSQILAEMIHPEEREAVRSLFVNSIKTGNEFHCEHRIITPAGETRWLDVRGEVFFGADNRAVSISGTAQNITETKIAQEAVIESEKRLNTVINNLAEGLIVSDLQGDLLIWNRASLQMHGFSSANIPQHKLPDFHEMFELKTLDGKVLDYDDWVMPRIFRGETLQNVELIISRKDIEWERIFSYSGARVKEANGKEIAFLSISDVTEKKFAEDSLKKLNEQLEQRVIERTKEVHESEERLRLVGENGTDGYWDWNLITDETYMSPSFKALFGYEDKELPNAAAAWQSLIFPEDRERARQAYLDHINENKPYNLQLRYRHKNGSTVWVNCRGVALKNKEGKFIRMVGTHISITQQKLAEEALYKLNSQLEQRVLEKTKEVRESEEHFRQLSEGLPLLVWTCRGEDGKCDYLSPQWVEYTGIPEDTQLGFGWLEQIHPDDRDQTINAWLQQTKKGTQVEMEFRIRRFDGVYRWFQTIALPLKSSSGKILKWFGTNVDIDDRKLNEQTGLFLQDLSVKVSKSENLEAALEKVLSEIRSLTEWELGEVWMPDEVEDQLNLVQISCLNDEKIQSFCEESRHIKLAFGEGFPGLVWETKKSLWVKDVISESRFLRAAKAANAGIKSGIAIPILMDEKVVAVMTFFSTKLRSGDERGIRLVSTVASQIGEFLQRKRAENELKQSQARLQLGVSVARMALIEIDFQASQATLSREAIELFGLSPEHSTISRQKLREMIHPEDREKMFELVEKALDPQGDRLLQAQHRIIRTDGQVRWLNVKEQIFFGKDKNAKPIPQKAILVFLDITETKQMEEVLRISEERLKLLHRIVSNSVLTSKEKIYEIIKLGAETFGLESGLLGKIVGENYRVVQSIPPTRLPEGFEFELKETICEETIKSFNVLDIEDVAETEWKKHSLYANYDINAYIGISIKKFNSLYGTLCFYGTSRLVPQISTADKEFLKLMAQWIGAELTRNEAEDALRESEERFRILFEQSPAGKVIIDLETTKYVDCNSIAAEILGYPKEELCRLKIADVDIYKSPEESALITNAVKKGGKIQYETINRSKSGELKNLLVVSAGVQVKGKKYSYSSFLDITEMKKAEYELERERLRFEKIAAVSPSVILSFRISPKGEVSFPYASQAVFDLYSATPEELKIQGDKAFSLIHPEDKERIQKSIEESRRTMTQWNETWRICHPDKGEMWVEGHSAPTLEPDGSVIWHGVVSDVTERKRQENELAERERLITAIFNTAPSLIVLWDLPKGIITYANEASTFVLGFERDKILRFKKDELFGRIHPDDLSNVWEFIKQLRYARDGEVLSHEYRYLHPSGEWRILQSQDTVFERDDNGKVIKTLNIVDDITDRKIAERALRESEERFVKAFEANPAAVVFTRFSDGIVIDVNKSFENIFGYVADEVIGRNIVEIDILTETDSINNPLETFRENSTIKNLEVPLKTKSGEIIFTLISNELIELNGEQCVLSIIYDITARKHAEEELRKTEEKLVQAQKLESVGRLAGGIAHDFNNMLTAINGYSDLTLRQIGDKSPLRHNLEEIRKAGHRSAELTQQLLAFSRKQVLKPEIINLNSVINETITLLKRLIGEDVLLETILRSDISKVKVDPARLSQVIINLAVNSRDAMPNGGILTIETSNVVLDEHYAERVAGTKVGDYVMLTVSDTGIGMSEEQKEHIFEPFYTTKEVGKGTGLGLATVYGFVKQSEGYIWVYSEPENGTSFKIYLPAIQDEEERNMEAGKTISNTKGSETILLVEDEELVRNLNREILESYGYKVIEAGNGVEALKICAESEIIIDLLMTDVVMPEMGGSELASKLAITHPQLKVLFTSGYTDDAVVRHGVIDESANFLQKPFSLDALLTKIREILDKKSDH